MHETESSFQISEVSCPMRNHVKFPRRSFSIHERHAVLSLLFALRGKPNRTPLGR
jgi:hypothetical protein